MEYLRLGDLNNRHLFSHSSLGWKSQVKVQQGWCLVRALFLACRQLISLCCVLMWWRERDRQTDGHSWTGLHVLSRLQSYQIRTL